MGEIFIRVFYIIGYLNINLKNGTLKKNWLTNNDDPFEMAELFLAWVCRVQNKLALSQRTSYLTN